MKTTVQSRVARLAGLLLLSSIFFATGAQAAQAALVADGGAGSGTSSTGTAIARAGTQGRGGADLASTAAGTALAGTQGRGGVALAQNTPTVGQASATSTTTRDSRNFIGRFQPTADVLATQPASTSASSTSAWIAAGSAAAIFLVGLAAWSLTRRRGQAGRRPSDAYCEQHPDDALCSAA